ncbi:MAG: hypothetical protein HYV13_00050 [Candidatus Doudnabacteria bacterium]|nr:hypothetical protein [Candidatus Doudnabacteria bacterium]
MNVLVTIEGDDLSFKTNTNLLKAAHIIAFLNAEQRQVLEKSDLSATAMSEPNLVLSSSGPRQVIIDSNAKTNAQKITAFAVYLRNCQNLESFKPVDIKRLFEKSGEPAPKNLSRDFKTAIQLGYVFELDSGSDDYALSESGLKSVENSFKEETEESPRKRRRVTNARGTNIKIVREEVKNLIVSPNSDELGDFHNQPSKGMKIIWILAYAYLNNITSLTSTEIEYISTQLLEKISTNAVSALTESFGKKGYFIKSENRYQIQKKGLDSLKQKQPVAV